MEKQSSLVNCTWNTKKQNEVFCFLFSKEQEIEIFQRIEDKSINLGKYTYSKERKGWVNKENNSIEKLPIVLVVACIYEGESCYLTVSGSTQFDLMSDIDKRLVMTNSDRISLVANEEKTIVGKKPKQTEVHLLLPKAIKKKLSKSEQEKYDEINEQIDLMLNKEQANKQKDITNILENSEEIDFDEL